MTYNTFLAVVEKTSRVKLCDAIDVLEDLYKQAIASEDAIDEYCKIYDLVDSMFQHGTFIGDGDDYHNIAVTCAKQDDYDTACRFLDYGLHQFPYNIDLLADYLQYGMKCNEYSQCEKVYTKLISKKNNWNGRAYKFAINYLIELSNTDLVERDQEIISLIYDFQKKLPSEEDAYFVEAKYLENKQTNDENQRVNEHTFVSVLQFATSDISPVRRTPKCDLKLADYYYKNGTNIEKALELLERCKKDSVEVQLSVNRNYVYLLSSLCKINQYYDLKFKNILENEEELIGSIYQDYHIAALGRTDSRVNDCKKIIESFVRETKMPYPYDDAVDNAIY